MSLENQQPNPNPEPPPRNSSGEDGELGSEPAAPEPASPPLLQTVLAAAGLGGSLTPSDLALFAEALASMVRSRIPLPKAFALLGKEARGRRMRAALAELERDTAAGVSLAQALRKHPRVFPEVFVRLVDDGPSGGDLHGALLELVREYRAQDRFRSALWSQLLTPVVTLSALGAFILLAAFWNLPQIFRSIYNYAYYWRPLPWPTRVVLAIGDAVRDPYFFPVFGLSVLSLIVLFSLAWSFKPLRSWTHGVALHLPVLGPYLKTASLARFCRLLGLLLRRKIPLNSALTLTRDILEFAPVHDAVDRISARVDQGERFSTALESERLFPATFAQFIRGAEEHGDLPETLARQADLYEDRGEYMGHRLRFFIYLFAQITVGLLVLLLIVAFLTPIFSFQTALRRR